MRIIWHTTRTHHTRSLSFRHLNDFLDSELSESTVTLSAAGLLSPSGDIGPNRLYFLNGNTHKDNIFMNMILRILASSVTFKKI